MSFLLDTNVISELHRANCHADVDRRLDGIARTDLLTSSIVFGELAKGVSLLPRGKKREGLENWLDRFEENFEDRILAFDTEVAKVWGRMIADSSKRGLTLQPIDSQIAATALHHKLTVVTRNEKDFAPTGAPVWNPWSADAP